MTGNGLSSEAGFFTSRLDEAVGWARKFSIFQYPLAPVLKRIYDQMAEPKWVVSFGVCICTGGFYVFRQPARPC